MSNEKQTKAALIREALGTGLTDVSEIFRYIADNHGVVMHLSHIRGVKREEDLKKRVEAGHHKPAVTKPYATSALTGNPVANEYLKSVESTGGGYLKTCVYDIETTNFFADFGYVLTAVFKDVDTGEHKVFRLDETSIFKENLDKFKRGEKSLWNDKDFWDVIDIELVDAIRKEFANYNLCITYNGKWFDEMFLNTRLLRCQLPGLAAGVKHMDILRVTQKVMKTKSHRLDSVKNFLKIDNEVDTHEWAMWRMAGAGIKEGFDFVVDHNIKDVEQLHEVARTLKNYANFFVF